MSDSSTPDGTMENLAECRELVHDDPAVLWEVLDPETQERVFEQVARVYAETCAVQVSQSVVGGDPESHRRRRQLFNSLDEWWEWKETQKEASSSDLYQDISKVLEESRSWVEREDWKEAAYWLRSGSEEGDLSVPLVMGEWALEKALAEVQE